MNSTTTTGRRHSVRIAALASIAALALGTAACGSETAADNGKPVAPAAEAQVAPHTPMSADAAERWGASEHRAAQQLQEQYLRHLASAADPHRLKLRRQSIRTAGGREIPLP